jgi:hypothetical protein
MAGIANRAEQLRQDVIGRLTATGTKENLELARFARLAIINSHWGNNGQIQIGLFQSDGEFYTLFFHEAGHTRLNVEGSTLAEEDLCHDFSRKKCLELGLPHSREIEISARNFANIVLNFGGDETLIGEVEKSIPKNHRLTLSLDFLEPKSTD